MFLSGLWNLELSDDEYLKIYDKIHVRRAGWSQDQPEPAGYSHWRLGGNWSNLNTIFLESGLKLPKKVRPVHATSRLPARTNYIQIIPIAS